MSSRRLFDGAQQEIGSLPIVATTSAATRFWIRVSGEWKSGITWIRVAGTWQQAERIWFKNAGTWQ